MYSFSTAQFGLSDAGIHLLRNGYNFKTLTFEGVTAVEVKAGRDVKNWILVLVIGLALTTYGIADLLKIYQLYFGPAYHPLRITRLVVPVFPLMLGVYSIVISLRRNKVMIVIADGKKHYLSLREIDRANQLSDFLQALRSFHRVRTP